MRFYNRTTFLHQLDVRVKIVATSLLIILLFFIDHFISFFILALGLVLLSLLSGLPLKVYCFMYNLKWIILFTFIMNFLFFTGENPIWTWHFFTLYEEGVSQAGLLIIRLLLMMVVTSILIATSDPLTLTRGWDQLLSPLEKMNVSTTTMTLMISLALRFVPTFLEEKERLEKAQASRGAHLDKAKGMSIILIPLLISAFKKAEDLSMALISRGFSIGEERTAFRQMKLGFLDVVAFLFFMLFLAFILFFERQFM